MGDNGSQSDAAPFVLPGLISKLSPDPQTAERALQDLVAQARVLAETPLGVRDED